MSVSTCIRVTCTQRHSRDGGDEGQQQTHRQHRDLDRDREIVQLPLVLGAQREPRVNSRRLGRSVDFRSVTEQERRRKVKLQGSNADADRDREIVDSLPKCEHCDEKRDS